MADNVIQFPVSPAELPEMEAEGETFIYITLGDSGFYLYSPIHDEAALAEILETVVRRIRESE